MTLQRIILLVGALLLASAGLVLGLFFLSNTHRVSSPPPTIVVQASYSGANAPTVAETVAAPIEQQVNGVEQMVSLSSRSASDGSYTLRIEFQPGTDLDMAQRLVQERVSLASSLLPEVVQREGITIRKKLLEPLMLLSLTSPDGRYDELYLSNYASLRVKDELARLPGVGDVVLFGEQHLQMRITLDGDKLAAHQLTIAEVVKVLQDQQFQVSPGAIREFKAEESKKFLLFCRTSGKTEDSRQLHGVVLPTTTDGQIVRLTDVASIEMDRSIVSGANINGEPAVLLGIQPSMQVAPSEVRRVVLEKWEELRAAAPEALAHGVVVDSANPEYLVIDLQRPSGLTTDRVIETLNRTVPAIQKTSGVQDVVTLTRHPFTLGQHQMCLIVTLAAKNHAKINRAPLAGELRHKLNDNLPGFLIQVSLPSFSGGLFNYGYPVELVIEDRGQHGDQLLSQQSLELVKKMQDSGKYLDIDLTPGSGDSPALIYDIDRQRCQALGVSVSDIFATLQTHARSSDLELLQVKNNQQKLVPIVDLVRITSISEPAMIERHNLYPSARITANLAEGISLREAKAFCEELAEQEFSGRAFKLIWTR